MINNLALFILCLILAVTVPTNFTFLWMVFDTSLHRQTAAGVKSKHQLDDKQSSKFTRIVSLTLFVLAAQINVILVQTALRLA